MKGPSSSSHPSFQTEQRRNDPNVIAATSSVSRGKGLWSQHFVKKCAYGERLATSWLRVRKYRIVSACRSRAFQSISSKTSCWGWFWQNAEIHKPVNSSRVRGGTMCQPCWHCATMPLFPFSLEASLHDLHLTKAPARKCAHSSVWIAAALPYDAGISLLQ